MNLPSKECRDKGLPACCVITPGSATPPSNLPPHLQPLLWIPILSECIWLWWVIEERGLFWRRLSPGKMPLIRESWLTIDPWLDWTSRNSAAGGGASGGGRRRVYSRQRWRVYRQRRDAQRMGRPAEREREMWHKLHWHAELPMREERGEGKLKMAH